MKVNIKLYPGVGNPVYDIPVRRPPIRPGRGGWLGLGIGIGTIIAIALNKARPAKPPIPWGYRLDCSTVGLPFMADTGGSCLGVNVKGWLPLLAAGCSTATNCTNLQIVSIPTPDFPTGNPANAIWCDGRIVSGNAQVRVRMKVSRIGTGSPYADPQPVSFAWPEEFPLEVELEPKPGRPAINPNIPRELPTRPKPEVLPEVEPLPPYVEPAPGDTPVPDFDIEIDPSTRPRPRPQTRPRPRPRPRPDTQPGPAPNPGPGPAPSPGPAPAPGPGPKPGPKPTPQPGGSPVPPGRPPLPAPPKKGERERKVERKGGAQTILRVLDAVSEGAEVVDCFFSQLPKAKQLAWARKALPGAQSVKQAESARQIDRLKAYGLNGADWKLLALYHNWSSFSDEQIKAALECAATNVAVDEFIGGGIRARNRLRPRNLGSTLGTKKQWGRRQTSRR